MCAVVDLTAVSGLQLKPIFCWSCDALVDERDNYCRHCGVRLDRSRLAHEIDADYPEYSTALRHLRANKLQSAQRNLVWWICTAVWIALTLWWLFDRLYF